MGSGLHIHSRFGLGDRFFNHLTMDFRRLIAPRQPGNPVRIVIMFVILACWAHQALALDFLFGRAFEDEPVLGTEESGDSDFEVPVVTFELLAGEPHIDGHLDDLFWQQTNKFSIELETYPVRLGRAAVPTEAWVGVTHTHVYVAFDAYDPDPSQFRSALKERDSTREDDYVSVVIDPYGQGAKKLEFRVNPHGTESDIFQNPITDRYLYDWDTKWDSAARITDTGYQVEMAIPLSSLDFLDLTEDQERHGIVMLKRSYPRRVDRFMANFFKYRQETASPSDNVTRPTDITPSVASEDGDVTPETGVGPPIAEPALAESSDNHLFTPHVIYHFDEERNVGGSFDQVDDHDQFSAGFDLTYNIDHSRSFNLTAKPNYTEVEEDIARESINNPFIPFKPEKRSFFQDADEYFASLTKVVYTRNIIEPEFGVSYLGSTPENSLGAFWVKDLQTSVIMPDNLGNETVELLDHSESAAFHLQVPHGKQTLGVHGTYRKGDDYDSKLLGVGGFYNLGIDDKLRYQLMYSHTEYPESFADDLCETADCTRAPPPADCAIGNCNVNAAVLRADYSRTLKGHGFRVNYKHDGPKSIYWANYYDVAPDFRGDLGFLRQVDLRAVNLGFGRNWYIDAMQEDRGKSRLRLYGIATHIRSHDSNDELDTSFAVFGEFRGTHQTVFRPGYWMRERAVNRIDQSSLAVGDNAPLFDEDYLQWYFETSPVPNATLSFDGRYGDLTDSDNMLPGTLVELEPSVRMARANLELILSGEFRDFDVDGGRLYREEFLTLTMFYRQSHRITHRLQVLDDTTSRDTALWRVDEPAKEKERSLQYTLIYRPTKEWKVLAGVKLADEYDEVQARRGLTDREVYLKVAKEIEFGF